MLIYYSSFDKPNHAFHPHSEISITHRSTHENSFNDDHPIRFIKIEILAEPVIDVFAK